MSRARPERGRSQRPIKVCNQVIAHFKPNRQSDHFITGASGDPLCS
jgi:hypothetical protein